MVPVPDTLHVSGMIPDILHLWMICHWHGYMAVMNMDIELEIVLVQQLL